MSVTPSRHSRPSAVPLGELSLSPWMILWMDSLQNGAGSTGFCECPLPGKGERGEVLPKITAREPWSAQGRGEGHTGCATSC